MNHNMETQHHPAKTGSYLFQENKMKKAYAFGGGILISSKEETRVTLKHEYVEGTERNIEGSSSFIQTRSANKDFILFFSCLLP